MKKLLLLLAVTLYLNVPGLKSVTGESYKYVRKKGQTACYMVKINDYQTRMTPAAWVDYIEIDGKRLQYPPPKPPSYPGYPGGMYYP